MPLPCFSIGVILDITARIMGMEHMPIEPTRAAEMYSPTIIKLYIYIVCVCVCVIHVCKSGSFPELNSFLSLLE